MDFAALSETHRRELRVHCYRLVGSYDEAEDLVQETLLKAWRRWDDFAGRSSVRTWLFRIATNTCLDHLDGRARRGLPDEPGTVAWLQPYPEWFAGRDATVAALTRSWDPDAPDDRIAEMTAFHDPHLFPIFGLPMSFPGGDRLPG